MERVEAREILKSLELVKASPAWELYQRELKERFDNLYLLAMDLTKSDSERVRYLEQQRGIAFAVDLLDAIEERLKEVVDESDETE